MQQMFIIFIVYPPNKLENVGAEDNRPLPPAFNVLCQVDESTYVSSCTQLLVLVRYIHSRDIKEEFLFCNELDTRTTSADIMEKMKTFFEATGLQWEDVCGVCTDGASLMLGSRSGF